MHKRTSILRLVVLFILFSSVSYAANMMDMTFPNTGGTRSPKR